MGGWRQVRGKAETRGERQEEQGQRPPGSQSLRVSVDDIPATGNVVPFH